MGRKGATNQMAVRRAHMRRWVVQTLLETGIEDGILVNVNFPRLRAHGCGHRVATQGQRNQETPGHPRAYGRRGNHTSGSLFARAVTPGNGTDLKAIAEHALRSRRSAST
jgi:5'-nucleotidase